MTKSKERFSAKILKGDRVAIPKQIMLNKNLKAGDWVAVKQNEKGFTVVSIKWSEA